MKNALMPLMDKLLLRKRAIIETIIDQLKNISQIEHLRHRSPLNFLVNLLCGLIAYCRQPKKPSLGVTIQPAAEKPGFSCGDARTKARFLYARLNSNLSA